MRPSFPDDNATLLLPLWNPSPSQAEPAHGTWTFVVVWLTCNIFASFFLLRNPDSPAAVSCGPSTRRRTKSSSPSSPHRNRARVMPRIISHGRSLNATAVDGGLGVIPCSCGVLRRCEILAHTCLSFLLKSNQ